MLKHVLVLTAILSATSSQAMDRCYGQDSHGRQRRFILTEGEATDTKTGLIWMRCGLGTDWRSSRCDVASSSFSLSEANRRAEKLGSGWRVPSGPELQTLIDRTCGKPVVDTVVFPDSDRIRMAPQRTGPPTRSTWRGFITSSTSWTDQVKRILAVSRSTFDS
jgi:hypothetical protein